MQHAEITPELIAYMKAIVAERGINQQDMTKETMREIMAEAFGMMLKLVDDLICGRDFPGHRSHDAIKYMAVGAYNSIPCE